MECDYVVIGGGFAGLHCAKKLANVDFRVTVIESSNELMSGATRHNMARIHLGWHYPGSLETALGCIPAAFDFLEAFGDVLLKSKDTSSRPFQNGLCALAVGSFTSEAELRSTVEAMRSCYAQELAKRGSSFGAAEDFYRVLDEKKWRHILNFDRIAWVASTLEPFVNLPALEAMVVGAVRNHPNISVLTNHEVLEGYPITQSGKEAIALQVKLKNGSIREFRANRVLNASWTSRRKLDMSIARYAGVDALPNVTYRLRALSRVRLTGNLSTLPSVLAVHGPFFTFTNCGDGTGVMMYEPVSNVSTRENEIPREWIPILSGNLAESERVNFSKSIRDGVSEFMPALKHAEHLEVAGSVVYHGGHADIYDPVSAVHHRLGTGVKIIANNWISLDTGKLSWIPSYARQVVELSNM